MMQPPNLAAKQSGSFLIYVCVCVYLHVCVCVRMLRTYVRR